MLTPSERADAQQTRAEGTGALTQPSIVSGPKQQRSPHASPEVGQQSCVPRTTSLLQPLPEALSQTERRAQG